MTAEVFTPKQLENQRLFKVGPGAALPEMPGDTSRRVRNKAMTLVLSTAGDLVESWGAEALLDKVGERVSEPISYGMAFVEDAASDELYDIGMNVILRRATGLDEVSYSTPTAKFAAGWLNLLSFASGKFQNTIDESLESGIKKLAFWKKPWNFVNAVNTEAAIGLLEEIPFGIGNAIQRAHALIDKKLTKSDALQFVNKISGAAVTGYHVNRNMMHDSRPVADS